ncbi:MAG: hypothetical protein IJK07_09330 [Bacteroidales bacterium]|nr:hypothetical protein [Bacteroidales bacterium]
MRTFRFLVLVAFALSPFFAAAQVVDYAAGWRAVDSFEMKQYYTQAYTRADQLYAAAVKEGNSRQSLVAAQYLSRIGSAYRENGADTALMRFRSLLPSLQPLDASVCRILMADYYASYYSRNRWRVERNSESDEAGLDIALWSTERLRDSVDALVRLALADTSLLMQTPSEALGELATIIDGTDGDLTPTAFDVVARKALELLTMMNYERLLPSDIGSMEMLFAESEMFTILRMKTKTETPAQFALETLQQMERLHLRRNDGDSDGLMIELYIFRDVYVRQFVNFTDPQYNDLKLKLLPKVIARYRHGADSRITQLYSDLANLLYGQNRYVEAVAAIDTALALFPDSPGGVSCHNLRCHITAKVIRLDMNRIGVSSQSQLAVVHSTNVDHLYFRVINYVDYYNRRGDKEMRSKLLQQKVIEQWDQPVALRGDYKRQDSYTVVPPLPQGDYLLLVSDVPGFDTGGIATLHFKVEDIVFVADRNNGATQRGFVIERATGRPVANLFVKLKGRRDYNSPSRTLATTSTDKDGYYDFSPYVKADWKSMGRMVDTRVSATYKGYEVSNETGWLDKDSLAPSPMAQSAHFFFDRPVYKPGDTVSFAHLTYRDNRTYGFTVPARDLDFILKDINGKSVDTLTLVSDEYGLCEGRFVLPADATPGQWSIRTGQYGGESKYFIVEAYKQPKFTVTLSAPAKENAFGQTARFEGVAASYSAVPISGAKVSYTVDRNEMHPWWRRGWDRWWHPAETKTVVSGEVVTADDGTFNIDFVPMPDSNADFGRKPCFTYTVNVDVTDINGETHSARASINVGFVNSFAYIDENDENRDDVSLALVCRNLDGQALDGTASIEVVRLAKPDKPRMRYDIMDYNDSTIAMPLGRSEFERLFPYYDYDGSASDIERWPAEKSVFSTQVRFAADSPYRYSLKGLAAGAYRLRATVRTVGGDTMTATKDIVYEPSGARRPVGSALLSASVDKAECEVGDSLTLRLGSRYDDVAFYVLIHKHNVCYRHLVRTVSNGFIEVVVPVGEEMLGGFKVEVAAVKANVMERSSFDIEVPYSDKRLDVSFETFRDKLEPGSNERWTLRIKDRKSGKPIAANLLMTMYDHALDTYGSLNWHLSPWSQNSYSTIFGNINYETSGSYGFAPNLPFRPNASYRYRITTLKEGFFERQYASNRMYKTATARGESGFVVMAEKVPVIEVGVAESGQRLTSDDIHSVNSVNSVVASVAGVGYIDDDAELTNELQVVDDEGPVESKSKDPSENNGDEPQLRQNLNTLAFFRPTLRSGDDGLVELSFTAPELLTEWSISGLAWTKDLKVGNINARAITQKRLMVVPNVPRFLRHGDTCVLSVKVSNLSGKDQTVDVSLEMLDAVSNEPLPMVVGGDTRRVAVKDGASSEVSFVLAAPRVPVFMANYRVIARGDGVSDGEQAAIPLLPSRQLVTESMAFYINGAGEKEFELKHLMETAKQSTDDIDWTLKNHSLTVDLTPNPIWLAIQSLPYVAQQKNPSNIYLANAIYTNSLSFNIVKSNPQIEQLFREWEQNEPEAFQSELDRNTDLKQTVMDETPWLRDAIGEEQRHRDVARFFNRTTLSRQLQKDLDQLLAAQRADGGWSWIDGGRWSSLYTTQYILKSFGHLRQQGVELDSRTRRALDRAMDYVDKETYTYYIKYVKSRGYDVVNLDYLYLRSLYPDNKLSKRQQEAYDFFYGNAKKYNENYRSLFTQAMLGVVFQRAGDTKLAREMAVRIREKALYSDEMGMYWRDNVGGWSWSERPIETQAMLIRTFDEVLGDSESIAKMQQWLLKQKQTTNWNTDVSTVSAIQALLLNGKRKAESGERKAENGEVRTENPNAAASSHISHLTSRISVTFGSHTLATDTSRAQLHISRRLPGDSITPDDGHLTVRKADNGIAWGAMYWQYFENIEKIPASAMGITIKRSLYKVDGDKLIPATQQLKVGDKVRVRIEISADRNMEYLELKDPRCAGFEPVSTQSGWHWNGGLSYYLAITNTAHTLYIDRIEKGSYVAEYDLYVNNAGTFLLAPATMQCLYAPEFRASSAGGKMQIVK